MTTSCGRSTRPCSGHHPSSCCRIAGGPTRAGRLQSCVLSCGMLLVGLHVLWAGELRPGCWDPSEVRTAARAPEGLP